MALVPSSPGLPRVQLRNAENGEGGGGVRGGKCRLEPDHLSLNPSFVTYSLNDCGLITSWLSTAVCQSTPKLNGLTNTSIFFTFVILWVHWAQLGGSAPSDGVSWGCTSKTVMSCSFMWQLALAAPWDLTLGGVCFSTWRKLSTWGHEAGG